MRATQVVKAATATMAYPWESKSTIFWVRVFVSVQILMCLALAVVSALSYTAFDSTDSPWYYVLQVPVSIMLLLAEKKVPQDSKRSKVVLFVSCYPGVLGRARARAWL